VRRIEVGIGWSWLNVVDGDAGRPQVAIDRAVDQIAAAERRLAADMLNTGQCGRRATEIWLAAHPEATRIRRSVEEIAVSGLTLAKLTVAANLLGDLVKS
jgi:glutamate dehydrogenase